ncbi:MAG: T9SS type A sorting domain-containing protein, partial [Flavobacteriales bacterium]|nr:T9SS type A sorting domain-containing protein [Flavobacteriales bacterium]
LLGGVLTLDETNPCIPQLCGSITGQSGNMESVTISYPAVWLDPVLVSSSCDICLDAADYSVPGEVTLNFNQDYIVSDPTSFDFCFDFNLVDPLIWANGMGMTSADLVLSFDYLTPCGDTLTSQPDSALWEVPNPLLTSSMEINLENCSPVACITYTNEGDVAVGLDRIAIVPYWYGTLPVVTSDDCVDCEYIPNPVSATIMDISWDDPLTIEQLIIAPGEMIELCIEIPIDNPDDYVNTVLPLEITSTYSLPCTSGGNLQTVNEGSFNLYQNFDFTLAFNETNATCLNGSSQNDGSVNILPYDPVGFDYAWIGYPGGFDPLPFVSNPTNMPPGDYVLTLTDAETGCDMDYPVTISSEECCQITLNDSTTTDCFATLSFDVVADCASPTVDVNVTDPNGSPASFTEDFTAGVLEVSFETSIDGAYVVDVFVFCGAGPPCDTLSVNLYTDPGCLSVPEPNCFAIWDNESINTYFMEGNAVISSVNTTKYSVLGSAHEPDALLNYYNARLDGEDAYIYARDFGDDATANSKTEYIIDAVEYNGFIYNVGYGAYPGGSGERNCFMISKIDMETGIPVVRKRYHLSNSSNDVATGIDIYQTPSGETRLFVAGYTDVNQAQRGIDAFATSFSLNLAIANLYTYDFMNKNNYAYEVKNVGQNSHFVVVGKVETLASAFMLDYNFNVIDEFTFKSKVSELTSVELDGNQLYFVGNYSPNANETKAMIFKSGLSWGNGTTFRTLENSGDSENFDWARDLVIYNSRVYIAGQSGENSKRGLLVELNPSTLNPVWSKHTDPQLSLKAVSDILHLDNSIGIIAVGDTKAGTEDAIAVVHSDLDGNSCCLSTTTMKVDQGVDNFLFGYTRIQRQTANVNLNLGLTPFEPLPICDPEFKNAEDVLMVSSPNADLYVVPNPNDGQFELMLSAQEAWLTQVVILDVTGQEIFTSTYPAQDQIRSLSIGAELGLKSGMYLVHVRLSNGEELSTRAVVGR